MSRNPDTAAPTIRPLTVGGPASPLLVRFDSVILPAMSARPSPRPLTFDLAAGAFAFITGPAGSGKTEVLEMIALASRPEGGRVEVFGRDIQTVGANDRARLRRRLGLWFQDLRLIDTMSVFDNVALAARVTDRPAASYTGQAIELLRWVGLGEGMDALAASLTLLGRSRLALARALINGPELLIADEPTGQLEQQSRLGLFRLLAELNQAGTAVLVATRDEALADGSGAPVIRLRVDAPDGAAS